MTTYTAWYRSKAGDEIVIHSVTPPPKTRTLRGSGGLRKYKRVKFISTDRKVLIVAKTAKKGKGKNKSADEITDEELEDLEDLEELEDVEDEVDEPDDEDEDSDEEDDDESDDDEDEDEDDEDEDEDEDDEEEEEPAPKKGKKGKKGSSKKQSRSRTTDGKVGTQELADHLGITPRDLRMLLRKLQIPKDEETSRYEWSSMNHPQVKKIVKAHKSGATKEAKQEGLDKLKSKKTSKADKKQSSGKSSKSKKGKKGKK